MVFVKSLQRNARSLLSQNVLDPRYHTGGLKLMVSADTMHSLPQFFAHIPDPRRAQGRRHRLATVLAIAAAATLCGMRGYKAMANWAKGLGEKARERFGCRMEGGRRVVPSEAAIRRLLIGIDPVHLDHALQHWNETCGAEDKSLAIDGKTMCNAIDEEGSRTHIMSVVGHESKVCYTQKKWAAFR
jgi:hypothetical protein